jgi:antitoxin component YwqK of YwqJK toxin-antitoxin module
VSKLALHRFFLFVALSCGLTSYAQNKRVEVFYDARQKIPKQIFYVSDTLSMELDGPYSAYYMNGKLKEKGQYQRDTATGYWEYFYENGEPKMKGELKNGSNWGTWTYYFESGSPSMEGPIFDGMRQGDWVHYYESGSVKRKGRYLDNKTVGIWNYFYESPTEKYGSLKAQAFYENGIGSYKEFYPDEGVKAEGLYIDGKSEGNWTYYYKDGTVEASGEFRDGLRNGIWKFYHENGELSATGKYREGIRQGDWKFYNDNGTLSSEGKILNGEKEGFWQVYDQFGEFKGEGNFVKGEGQYKEFYESGKIKTVGTIQNDKFEGEWEYYYENGRLEGKAHFKDGKGYYYGYYPDGTLNMEGEVENGKRVGTWKMYKPGGELSGYYKVFYEENQPVYRIVEEKEPPKEDKSNYDLPGYRFPTRGFRYFRPQINEFKAMIVGTNPFGSLLGNWPLNVEYYIQERLGYELQVSYLRSPFYHRHSPMVIGDTYYQGISVAMRQKFYQPDNKLGMVWFGHELRASPVQYASAYQAGNGNYSKAEVESIKMEYSLLIGDRISENSAGKGWTVDVFAGIGIGYQFVGSISNNAPDGVLSEVRDKNLTLPIRVGFTIGYAFDRIK